MMICRMSFRWDMSIRRDSLRPSAVLVWYGPTWARASWASGISSAVSWNSTTRSVSPGNCVRIRCVSASATFFAGVTRSSPYRILESEQSRIRAVAEEIDAVLSEVELHLLRGFFRHSARPEEGLLPRRHLGRLGDVQVAVFDQLLDDLVEQLRELALQLGIPLGISGGFTPQQLEHLGGELPRLHQRLEDGLAQRVERAVRLVLTELAPEGMGVRASGEARLEEEIRELIEQGWRVDGSARPGRSAKEGEERSGHLTHNT